MGRAYRNDRFKSIFTIHAKTMLQLVGRWWMILLYSTLYEFVHCSQWYYHFLHW
jgi:hypothetical protein